MNDLFDNDKYEWTGMPEFVQEEQAPWSKIVVRFETENDFKSFCNLIDQKLTKKTKSIWFPFKSHWGAHRMIYKND